MKKIIFKKRKRFIVITTLCLVFVCLCVTYSCDKYEKSEIKHIKTELDVLYCGKDTVIITVSADAINVFVGISSIPRKWNPFETQVEIIDDVLYMRIIDKCDHTIDSAGCYGRGIPYPYYTFDFVFKYQGEIKQKYKVLLRTISIPLGNWPIHDSINIISEGIINSKNR